MQSKKLDGMLATAIFLEGFGILEKWIKLAEDKEPNDDLIRLYEVMMEQLKMHSALQQEIKDIKDAYSLLLDKKNKEMLELKLELNKYTI